MAQEEENMGAAPMDIDSDNAPEASSPLSADAESEPPGLIEEEGVEYAFSWELEKYLMKFPELVDHLANPHGGRQTGVLSIHLRNVAPGLHEATELCTKLVNAMASVGHPSKKLRRVCGESLQWLRQKYKDPRAMRAIAATNPKLAAALVHCVVDFKRFAASDEAFEATVQLLQLAGLWHLKAQEVPAGALAAARELLDPRLNCSPDRPLATLEGLLNKLVSKKAEILEYMRTSSVLINKAVAVDDFVKADQVLKESRPKVVILVAEKNELKYLCGVQVSRIHLGADHRLLTQQKLATAAGVPLDVTMFPPEVNLEVHRAPDLDAADAVFSTFDSLAHKGRSKLFEYTEIEAGLDPLETLKFVCKNIPLGEVGGKGLTNVIKSGLCNSVYFFAELFEDLRARDKLGPIADDTFDNVDFRTAVLHPYFLMAPSAYSGVIATADIKKHREWKDVPEVEDGDERLDGERRAEATLVRYKHVSAAVLHHRALRDKDFVWHKELMDSINWVEAGTYHLYKKPELEQARAAVIAANPFAPPPPPVPAGVNLPDDFDARSLDSSAVIPFDLPTSPKDLVLGENYGNYRTRSSSLMKSLINRNAAAAAASADHGLLKWNQKFGPQNRLPTEKVVKMMLDHPEQSSAGPRARVGFLQSLGVDPEADASRALLAQAGHTAERRLSAMASLRQSSKKGLAATLKNAALTLAHQARVRYVDGITGDMTAAASRREADAKLLLQRLYLLTGEASLVELTCGHPELAEWASMVYNVEGVEHRATSDAVVKYKNSSSKIIVEIYSLNVNPGTDDEELRDAKYKAQFEEYAKRGDSFEVLVMARPDYKAALSDPSRPVSSLLRCTSWEQWLKEKDYVKRVA